MRGYVELCVLSMPVWTFMVKKVKNHFRAELIAHIGLSLQG